MEINEATCLCRFRGCEVLGDGAHAESNYWSVTSRVECLDAKCCALTYADIHIGQWSSRTHLKTHVFSWLMQVIRFMWAWWVGGCENVRFPALPSTTCMPLHIKHIAHQKQLDLLSVSVNVCLWSGFLSHIHTHSRHSHTYACFLCSMSHTHYSDPPHTHPSWCSEVRESSGW